MKYNKSEIMKDAWAIFRKKGCYFFGTCLEMAWDKAKKEIQEEKEEAERLAEQEAYYRENNYVEASEIKVGDTIKCNGLGGYSDNSGNFTVTKISDELYLGEYILFTICGTEFGFEPNKMVQRISKVVESKNAA